ncbi:hypothetical protein ACOSP7_011181 [Xanthoceras sorbifolium]
MWSSSSGRKKNINDNNNYNNNNRVSISPSKSSSICSSPSSLSPSSPNASTRKSMEEVWKDINLASLHGHSDTATATATTNCRGFPGLILQDFFARPFNEDPPPPPPPPTTKKTRSKGAAAAAAFSNNESSSPLGDITAAFGSLAPPPKATMLSLNSTSGCDFHFPENRPNQSQRFNSHVGGGIGSFSFASSQDSPFDSLGSASPFHSFYKKRPQENDDNSDDRRHKRMIKNRESAARSRAYTNELELEVAHLLEENAELRRQLDKFLAASEKLPKKHSLCRTSTAPF